ncbi:MAG: transcriptional regulator, partial [Chloroflexia bacterium]|nr:transcriptional regulator [Chloroflexia bacterium]
ATLTALLEELSTLPFPPGSPMSPAARTPEHAVVIPLRMRSEAGVLSFFSTTTVFGTPVDITLSELAIESFFPANQATADTLREMAGGRDTSPAAKPGGSS